MKTQEIRSEEWLEFCEEFTRTHEGSLLTVQVSDPYGGKTEVARDLPLQELSFEKTLGCSDRIHITVGKPGKFLAHSILEPIHVRVKDAGSGVTHVQIDAEDGITYLSLKEATGKA
jgi:hypothetical protein